MKMAPWTRPRHGEQRPAAPGSDLITRIHNVALETPTTLPAAFDLSNVSSSVDARGSAAAYQSSSESETELPPPSTTNSAYRRPQHSRSMSHPFPSLFGSKNRDIQDSIEPSAAGIDRSQSAGTMPRIGPLSRTHKRNVGDGPSSGSKDYATGNCMTCASLVRWPRGLKVFKCTICATINDIRVRDDEPRSTVPGSSRRGTQSQPSHSAQPDATKGMLVIYDRQYFEN
jgi:E3 ubiquitin-protein ligase HECTD2